VSEAWKLPLLAQRRSNMSLNETLEHVSLCNILTRKVTVASF
jgi:hypothetical protein